MKRLIAALAVGTVLLGACRSGGSVDSKPEAISHVHGLGIDPANPRVLFVATHFGLYVRRGDSWSQRSEDKADHMGFTLTKDGMWRSGHPESGGSLGVQRSSDGGRTWKTTSSVREPPVDFHAMTAMKLGTIYGWDSGGRGFFRSMDGGTKWVKLRADGLPSAVAALATTASGAVYATTNQGIYRSSDRGQTWRSRAGNLLFALTASGTKTLYASDARGGGVVWSADGGKTWKDSGLQGRAIVALAAAGKTVVAADQEARVSISEDGGKTWETVPKP